MSDISADAAAGDRLAKVIARSGLCSRRDAEGWIKDGRVTVNGKKVLTPAFNVSEKDKIKVDGNPLAARQGTRVWLYHKPAGLVVTEKDPEGRPTIFEALAEQDLPRVVSIGRLDINTEGLLLLTNDGGLKRVLELPATGWLRRYRVRAFGTVTQPQLDALKDGITIDGVEYGPIEAQLERQQGSNTWLVLGLREGKNREVKNVLGELGLQVNRLIRVSFGPFQLGDLREGAVETVPARVLRDQLGKRLAKEAGADFESEMPEMAAQKQRALNPKVRASAPGAEAPARKGPRREAPQFRFEDDETVAKAAKPMPRPDRPGRGPRPMPVDRPEKPEGDKRRVLFEDGTSGTVTLKPQREKRERFDADDSSAKNFGRPAHHEPKSDRPRPPRDRDDRKPFSDKKSFGDRKFGDKKPFGSKPYGDRDADAKPFRPRRDEDGGARPPRSYGDKPAGDRPARSYGDRPARSFGDKPGFKPRREDGDARPPRKSFGDKSFGDRPARSWGDKPAGDRPARSYGDKPAGGRPFGGKPGGGKPFGGKPGGGGKPFGAKPYAGKPGGGGRSSSRPAGDRPRGPRPPRKPE